jgi:putative PIN family toxin of toxin-antitoxin system
MLPPSAVLDSNVIVSAHLNEKGNEATVLRLGLTGGLLLCLSEAILAEYELVLFRPKFRLDPELASNTLRLIRTSSNIVIAQRSLTVTPDASDNKFLECAEAVAANFPVTGNKRHFPKRWMNTLVVSARELLDLLAPTLDR